MRERTTLAAGQEGRLAWADFDGCKRFGERGLLLCRILPVKPRQSTSRSSVTNSVIKPDIYEITCWCHKLKRSMKWAIEIIQDERGHCSVE
jgi:hypothetical protein